MLEDPRLIKLSISHYQELLKLKSVMMMQVVVEHRVMRLMEEALAELPFAEAAARDRNDGGHSAN
jgi:hypothetical protein